MIGIINGLFTLLLLILFLAICVWAWSKHNTDKFNKMAHLPLVEDDASLNDDLISNDQSKGVEHE